MSRSSDFHFPSRRSGRASRARIASSRSAPLMQDSIDGGANRHLDFVPRRPRQHRRRRRLAFDDLAAALPCSRRASCPCRAPAPSERLRDSGPWQVSTRSPSPLRPVSVSSSRAHRLAEPRHLGEAARDQRGRRVVAEPAALDDAGGDRQHVLDRAAQRHAQHVVRPVGPEGAGRQRRRPASRPSAGSAVAMLTAVGRPRTASSAKLGPDSMAIGRPGRTSASTSGISSPLEASMPLAQMTTGRRPASRADSSRTACAGQTSRSASQAPSAVEIRRRLDAGVERDARADRPDWRDRVRSPRRSPDRATTR